MWTSTLDALLRIRITGAVPGAGRWYSDCQPSEVTMPPSIANPADSGTRRRFDLAGMAASRLDRAHRAGRAAGHPLPAFRVVAEDGSVVSVGDGEPAFSVMVRDRTGRAALASLDETRIALAYLDGHLDLEGDFAAVLAQRALLTDRHPLRALWSKALHPLVFGQVRSDAKWVAEHYDEDGDFYGLFLDSRRCYSHGLFSDPEQSLDDAILAKLEFALEAVRARPGQRVLDIGAGWGAMTEYGGRRGLQVTSLTISKPSEDFVTRLIEREGLPCRVERRHFLEYRSDEPFDAIVNLGVTEHLPDYPATLAQYRRLLVPGGRVYLDACASRTKFPFSSFTYRFVFPGNATPLCLHDYLAAVAETPFEMVGVWNDRESYLLTCLRWAENLDRHRQEIERRFGQRQFRRFQLYLRGCVDAFEKHDIGAYRVVLELPG
jgi:cyclopropane-fatty-acyl-phospholipid synthase